MTDSTDGGNATVGSEVENLRARVARLNSEVEAAELKAAALTDTQNALRAALKMMGWRKGDCEDETLRSFHNAKITDLLAILDGNTAVADAYKKGANAK